MGGAVLVIGSTEPVGRCVVAALTAHGEEIVTYDRPRAGRDEEPGSSLGELLDLPRLLQVVRDRGVDRIVHMGDTFRSHIRHRHRRRRRGHAARARGCAPRRCHRPHRAALLHVRLRRQRRPDRRVVAAAAAHAAGHDPDDHRAARRHLRRSARPRRHRAAPGRCLRAAARHAGDRPHADQRRCDGGAPLHLPDGADQSFHLVHGEDVCRAVLAALDAARPTQLAYNVTGGETHTLRDIAAPGEGPEPGGRHRPSGPGTCRATTARAPSTSAPPTASSATARAGVSPAASTTTPTGSRARATSPCEPSRRASASPESTATEGARHVRERLRRQDRRHHRRRRRHRPRRGCAIPRGGRARRALEPAPGGAGRRAGASSTRPASASPLVAGDVSSPRPRRGWSRRPSTGSAASTCSSTAPASSASCRSSSRPRSSSRRRSTRSSARPSTRRRPRPGPWPRRRRRDRERRLDVGRRRHHRYTDERVLGRPGRPPRPHQEPRDRARPGRHPRQHGRARLRRDAGVRAVHDAGAGPRVLDSVNAFHPLGRHGVPADVVEAILFYAGGGSSWITGRRCRSTAACWPGATRRPSPWASPRRRSRTAPTRCR